MHIQQLSDILPVSGLYVALLHHGVVKGDAETAQVRNYVRDLCLIVNQAHVHIAGQICLPVYFDLENIRIIKIQP